MLSRRSFLALVAGAAAWPRVAGGLKYSVVTAAGESTPTITPAIVEDAIVARRVYRTNGDGVYRLIATIADNTTRSYIDNGSA